MAKIAKFEDRNVDLSSLFNRVREMLIQEKFRVTKEDATEYAYHLKGMKTGVTRIIIGATRDIEIVIAGEPDSFAVAVMVGAWGKNIAISTVTGYVVASAVAAPAFAAGTIAAAGSYITAKRFEQDFFDDILKEIERHSQSSTQKTSRT